MRSGTRTAFVSALLFGSTVLLFSRTLGGSFVILDDPEYITGNPVVQRGLTWAGAAWAFTAPSDYWHPLAWLSHMLDCQLYGLSAPGHHLTSILWHGLNAVLVFLLFRALTGAFWRSVFAAALFAWHPLRVESVAWIAERKDVMSGCFFLLTLLAYVRYARADGGPARRNYLLALAAFAAGLMSKPMLVMTPFVLLALDHWPLARERQISARRRLLEKLPFFALAGAAAVATVRMQQNTGAFVLQLSLGDRLGNGIVSLARYLGKFFWPFDLIVCYPHPGAWPAVAIGGAAILLLGLAIIAWRQRRDRPWIATGFIWYLLTVLPVIGIIQVGIQAMADRYTYLPLLGVDLALVASLPLVTARIGRIVGIGAAAAVLGACALRTWNQEGVWKNSETLFAHAARLDPRNDVAESYLASALVAERRLDDARPHAERAVALNPKNDQALVALAGILAQQARPNEAIALYRSALALRPHDPPVECQLGLLEMARGDLADARAIMTPALKSAPALRARTLQLSRDAFALGHAGQALFLFDEVLTVAPDEAEAAAAGHPDLLGYAADFCARQGRFNEAIRLYRQMITLAPSDSRAHAALGYLLIHGGDRRGGMEQWRRALELEPALPELRERLRRMGE
jgi:Flp pilus assembly protein TadD